MILDGIIKGVLTSILGFAMICLTVYGWIWGDWFTSDSQALIFGALGFGLLFVREKLAEIMIEWAKNLIAKIGGSAKPPAP